jgi:aldose 1-epimerase
MFQQHGGLCLEAQKFPNSVNYQSFPTTVLKPTETYRQVTEHRFAW